MQRPKKSISKNSIFYMLYEVLNVLFPFLTGMYVARILLPTAVGNISYAQNIAQYFVILAFLGIPTYGLREISKVRYDQVKLSEIYSELVIINFCSTLIFGTIYLLLIITYPPFRDNIHLYLITGGAIAINVLNNSWLYTGLEEFQFISLRNIFFKCLAFIALVLLVKSPADYLKYAAITVMGTAGNYIINVLYAPRFVKFTLHNLRFRRHIKPIAQLVVVNLAIELYSLVDVTMLGLISTKENVAYYSYAHKIYKILIQVINSFTMVIVPRLALYYQEKEHEKFNNLLSKDLETIFVLGLPIIIGLQVVAYDAVKLLYGVAFINSAPVLRMLSFLLIVSPIGYLLGSRILLVTNNESKMITCVMAGAIVNIIGNAILIPRFAHIGAAIASIISEIVVMIVYVNFGKSYYKLVGIKADCFKMILSAIIMGSIISFVGMFISHLFIRVVVQVVSAVILYFALLYLLKERIVREYTKRVLIKVRRR